MKKQLLLLTVFFSLLLTNVFSQTVYITRTGKKYHVESCRYLSRSSFPISLSDAIARGYTACSICNPPLQATTNTLSNSQTKPRNSNSAQSVAVQCSAITKAGTRCKRMTKSPNGLCSQHGGD